ncbi:ATP-binding cassette domain-containing protein [Azospirillum sp. YIM B02556]|uniref:ATP-binding cassette domain-containing protein n=1 Tax=Azospirillum endophyticum TaxID=2800326 RepID=A0ABS1FFE2_9PROT|nr:ATP-binding cassette domain-containing protein [Azospirillum endophyticum]
MQAAVEIPGRGGNGADAGFVFGPVDLSVAQGELVFIIGGNGSGKSTFARLMAGL